MQNLIDYKLTKKQRSLLEVIADPANSKLTHKEKAAKAGINERYMYDCLKLPNFVQAIRLRGLSECLTMSLPIIKRMGQDALSGKYMQQKSMLEMSGHYTQTPLIQQVIANINQSGMNETDIDKKIAEFFTKSTDTTATVI